MLSRAFEWSSSLAGWLNQVAVSVAGRSPRGCPPARCRVSPPSRRQAVADVAADCDWGPWTKGQGIIERAGPLRWRPELTYR